MNNDISITTTIIQQPFRCVVCGYLNGTLTHRHETNDPWRVMQVVDEVHSLMQRELTK